MSKPGYLFLFLCLVLFVLTGLVGCISRESRAAQGDLVDQAALEATAIVQQAQATALVLQAQAQATAIAVQVNESTAIPEATWMAYIPSAEPTEKIETPAKDEIFQNGEEDKSGQTVEVVSVGFAGEGGFIMVRFYAPADIAEGWWQGSVSVEDESSGAVYNEIPEMPRIGPLIGRPKRDGQLGYVMLVNTLPGLQSGSLVTVALGEYRFEHIPVE